ncbi:hypothetical protein [Maribacter sp. Asnod2-G09]|uniref:hypothetical protein n=1 Tax=Maribacter sp. Asnod2-G09 TaxID=3160577 RepID=UPI00387079F0
MRMFVVLGFLLVFVNLYGQQQIQGRISTDGISLSDVNIQNLSSQAVSFTDKNGHYVIKAKPKDELRFTYVGMDTISILIEDVTSILNLKMQPKVEELDEVVLTEKISKQKRLAMNYFTDATIVNTSFGYISPANTAYHLKVIDGSEFVPGADVLNSIASRRSGIRVMTYLDNNGVSVRTLFLRGMGSVGQVSPALFEVDGNIFNDPPVWLDVSLIQRVAIIPGMQAVWRFGTIASGGVVIINTKNGVHGLREENSLKRYDQARLRNNYVNERILSDIDKVENLPTYMKSINSSISLKEALNIYEGYSVLFSSSPHFYIDSYNLFYEKFGKKAADAVIESCFNRFKNNSVWLKALAYYYESQNRFEKAHKIYEKIFVLRPEYTQSYLDISRSYRNLDNPEASISLLARHKYLIEEGYFNGKTDEFETLIIKETENLILSNSLLNAEGIENEILNTRLVFEWNDSEAEFNLQFVNPNNQYFNWNHTLKNIPDRIREEKKLGFSIKDFEVDESLLGKWQVNATYFGNKQLTPTYLKATIYRNYNSVRQTKETKVFRLDVNGANQQLFGFHVIKELYKSK